MYSVEFLAVLTPLIIRSLHNCFFSRCFISHSYASFTVAVIPVLLIILAICVVFVQAYQVTPQWKYYDDVYRGRYNIKGKSCLIW